jgi:hypothetical protein
MSIQSRPEITIIQLIAPLVIDTEYSSAEVAMALAGLPSVG